MNIIKNKSGFKWLDVELKKLIENAGNYEYLDSFIKYQYNNHYRYIKYICYNCDYINCQLLTSFLSGRRCKICPRKIKQRKKSWKQYDYSTIEKCQEFVDIYLGQNVFKVLNKNSYPKISFEGVWIKCNHKVIIQAGNIKDRHTKGCRYCKGKNNNKIETFSKILKERNITVINFEETYKNVHTKYKCICNICNADWESSVHRIIYREQGCPSCKLKGEKIVFDILKTMNFEVQRQHVVEGCIFNKLNNKFDFYIDELNLLIEVHGAQHRKETLFFGVSLEKQIEIDNYKRTFVKEHGYNYLEIDYDYPTKYFIDYAKEKIIAKIMEIKHEHN